MLLCTIRYKLFPVFTGIVEATAPVIKNTETAIVIGRPSLYTDLILGGSIAVSGVCLSVTAFDDNSIAFDVVRETRERSKIGMLQEGDMVNLERSVLADQRLDGHLVQGHVEGVGRVREVGELGNREVGNKEQVLLTVEVPEELSKFFVQKGSIALDGVSLTIASRTPDAISVALVPLTLANTTLGSLQEGDAINIETDVVGRYLYAFAHEAIAR